MSENQPEVTPADTEIEVPGIEDPAARAGRLEAELQQLRADLRAGAKMLLRVLPPHSSMTWGGITVTDEPTQVPASAVPGLQDAAAAAGVNLSMEA